MPEPTMEPVSGPISGPSRSSTVHLRAVDKHPRSPSEGSDMDASQVLEPHVTLRPLWEIIIALCLAFIPILCYFSFLAALQRLPAHFSDARGEQAREVSSVLLQSDSPNIFEQLELYAKKNISLLLHPNLLDLSLVIDRVDNIILDSRDWDIYPTEFGQIKDLLSSSKNVSLVMH